MNNSKISVIVPVYNVEKYLCQCVESLMKQTLTDLEIICVNDGSTDSSQDILHRLEKTDCRIKVIDKENTGYGDTLNTGISAAQGSYIGILESDDFAAPKMYELLYQKAMEFDADLVKSNYYHYYAESNKDVLDEYLAGLSYDKILDEEEQGRLMLATSAIWTGIYKKSFLENKKIKFLPTPGASYQDTSFAYKTALCSERTVLVSDALVYYRSDNENSSVKSAQKVFCICNEFEEIRRFIVENGYKKGISPYGPKMYSSYTWNLKRLPKENRIRFLLKMYYHFRELSFSGWLQKKYWGDRQWEEVHKLIFNFQEIYEAVLNEGQLEGMQSSDMKAIVTILGMVHPLFIYGAGQRGRRLLTALQRHQITPDGIIVTELAENPKAIEGVPVMDVKSAAEQVKDALMLLGVANKLKAEVLDILKQHYIDGNYLCLEDELLRMLEKDEDLE